MELRKEHQDIVDHHMVEAVTHEIRIVEVSPSNLLYNLMQGAIPVMNKNAVCKTKNASCIPGARNDAHSLP